MNKDKFTNDTTSVKSQSVPIKLASGDAPGSGKGSNNSGPKDKDGKPSNGDKSTNDEKGKKVKD